MGDGGVVFGEGGVWGRREGVCLWIFYVLLSIGWGFLSWAVFFSFSFSLFSGAEVCIFVFLFSLFAPFFSFSCPFLPLLFS